MKPHTVQTVSPLRIVLTNIAVIISHWSHTICWRCFYNDHLFPRLEVKSTALLHKPVIFGKKLYPGFSAQPSAGRKAGAPCASPLLWAARRWHLPEAFQRHRARWALPTTLHALLPTRNHRHLSLMTGRPTLTSVPGARSFLQARTAQMRSRTKK